MSIADTKAISTRRTLARASLPCAVVLASLVTAIAAPMLAQRITPLSDVARFPANGARNVNPDTHLVLTFKTVPTLGRAGSVRIYDTAAGALVDSLDLAIPSGPVGGTGGRGPAQSGAPPPRYQLTVIGGFTEGFHFYPVIVHDNVATIYPHNRALAYGKTYRVEIDPGVLTADGFPGITGEAGWTFSTKAAPPSMSADRFVVAGDGTGDFNTVQGAVDAVPDERLRRVTVFIRKGTYEEIVYFRHKSNITFLGEDRDATVVGYANNETFNGAPPGVATNEKPGTFPYRRAAFMGDASTGIELVNLSLRNFTPRGGGQAEALLLAGGRNIVSHVNLYGHQDTVQFNDSVYVEDSRIEGDTDFMWGRGPAFFRRCVVKELSTGPFMWVRSTDASHGFVFQACTFDTPDDAATSPYLARNTVAYPNSEVVLIDCALGLINPAAWQLAGDMTNMHYWEYRSVNLRDGAPADVSQRHPASKQLSTGRDARTIADYSDPTYVLGGWAPMMAPIVLVEPVAVSVATGQPATFSATVASIPAAAYQWRRNGAVLTDTGGVSGTRSPTLSLRRARAGDAGAYTLTAENSAGRVTSTAAVLMVR